MRKKMVTGMLAVSLMFMMTGCCLSHGWQEATCTEPKTCSKCGETEGEALGHTWQDADCTEPKTCSVCQETEGEALGHTLSEATYWEAAVCSVCGETVGDVLTPAFEELGVKGQFMEVGQTYDYVTQIRTRQEYEDKLINDYKEAYGLEGDYANFTDMHMAALENDGFDWDAQITAQAAVTDYRVFDSDETHEAKDGYEWKTVEIQIEYDGLGDGGWRVVYGWDDYYQKDEDLSPKGYDGVLLYLTDYKYNEVRPVNFAGKDENTLFFRLQ